MIRTIVVLAVALLLALALFHHGFAPKMASSSPTPSGPLNQAAVEQAIGKPGAIQSGNVLKFSFLRSDLQVAIGDIQLKPAFLGGWVAFEPVGSQALVYGDLVLTTDELVAFMTKLQEGGIGQTAVHDHWLGESPRLIVVHVYGLGDPVKMAETLHAALALTKTPMTAAGGVASPEDLGLDTQQLDQILGHSGKANGGVYQFSIPRAEKIMVDGMEMPPSMGMATAITFQSTGDGKAAITGDFAMTASEVNPVLRTLLENGIEVVALHSHMLTEEPRLFFAHFWANDDALKLARGLRAALDQTNIK
jgi:hypothetical protein